VYFSEKCHQFITGRLPAWGSILRVLARRDVSLRISAGEYHMGRSRISRVYCARRVSAWIATFYLQPDG
jgi:hypothetical protein